MESSSIKRRSVVRLGADARLPLTAVIFYHDVTAAGKAAALVNRLTTRFGRELEVETSLWSFEVLQLDEVMDVAMRRTAEADLLLVATPAAQDLPVHVRECLEGAMLLRCDRNLAVVALLDRVPPGTAEPACEYLKTLCRNSDDSFFCTHDLPLDDGELTPDRVRQRATATSSVLNTIMQRPLR